MKKIILILFLLAGISFAQRYGEAIPLDSLFSSTDSVALNTVAGLDSIPGNGTKTYYSGLERIGRPEGSLTIAFKADSNTAVGDTPYLQVYFRHLYLSETKNRDWGSWHLMSFKKDSAAFSSTTTYDSLTYGNQYVIQYKYDTYVVDWHPSNGIQYKVVTLDTLGVIPRLLHFPR